MKTPSLLEMVPSVVFWQKTDAPFSGAPLAESVTLPDAVKSCADKEKETNAERTNNNFFIENYFVLASEANDHGV